MAAFNEGEMKIVKGGIFASVSTRWVVYRVKKIVFSTQNMMILNDERLSKRTALGYELRENKSKTVGVSKYSYEYVIT